MTSSLKRKALLLKRTLALGKRDAVLYSVLAAKHSLKPIACCIGSAISFAVAFSLQCDRTSTSELWRDRLLATLHVSFGNSAQAQIVPDNTLGIERSVVTPVSSLSDRLDGGAIRGANLFHSFSQFNINEGRAAYFANPAGIENILSRVTGTNPSHIFGKLGVLGNANLFLLNPNGVIFGPNASLDVGGSFVTTTANSIIFSDGTLFSATNPETQPLLTIKVPIGVQFGTNQPGAIINAGSLAVAPRQNLALVGGTVVSTGQLSAPNGQLIVTAVPSSNQLPEHTSLANSSLPQLLNSWDGSEVTGLTLNSKGEVELTGTELRVDTGDVVVQQLTAGTATLAAAGNLTLVESQLQTTGNLNLLAGDTVRIRDSVAKPFLAQAGGNLYIQGNFGIDILALNHPETPFQSGGNLSLVSDGIISGDAHFSSGGDFSVLNLSGNPGNFISLYDPIISSQANVMLANYEGASLKIEAVGDIKVENITITQPDTMLVGSDPDIPILTSSPALILRAGVSKLENPPSTGLLYTIADLGRGSGNDVNEQGQVALTSLETRGGVRRAARWDSSTGLQNLGILPGDNLSRAYGINNVGQVIGNSYLDNRSRAVLWDSKGIQNLGTLPGANGSLTWDINDAGQVVGASGGQAVLWDTNTGTIQDLSALPASNASQARGINNAGQVVGFSGDRAVLWDTNTGSIQDLGTLDGANASEAWGINEAGQVVGGSGNSNTPGQCINECSAFLWNRNTGMMQDLGTLPGGEFSRAWDINNKGQVVGSARVDGQPRGFLWQEGQIYDLNELILSGSGWDNLQEGFAINEAEQIVGDGEINGQIHAFLMTPIETSSALPGSGSITIANVETLGGPIILSAASDINAAGAITSNGGNISLDSGGVINAVTATIDSASTNQTGNINLNARSIFLTQGTQVSASTFGSAQGGNVTVNASETVELSGVSPSGQSSFLLAETLGAGNAGNIELNTRTLILRDGAVISASVASESTGQGGKLTINSESVELNGTSPNGQFPSRIATATAGSGKAGDMEINTSQLVIQGGAAISTATISDAPGGNLTINSDTVQVIGTSVDGQLLSALSTDTAGAGTAGDLSINTEQLIVRDGAAVSSSTLNAGQGGNLIVNATDFVELSGTANNGFASGLYAQAFADGDAGNLTIDAGELRIFDSAKVTVAAGNAADARVPISRLPGIGVDIPPGQATGNAGNLEAKANLIYLNNQGAIIASTDSGEGGNIKLEARDLLLMRHNSLISAEARGTGNGGNVTIDAQFVVGVPKENSDIIANAFQGNGGRVQITTQGIYGLQFRPRLTPLSDITASSTFGVDGVVEINAPDVDPSRGLVQLPTEPVNPQLDQRCQSHSSQTTSRFVNTGRGGLPLSPEEISSNTVWEDLRTSSADAHHSSGAATVTLPQRTAPTQLVEAQGWVKLPDGRIILTAQAPTATASSSSLPVTTCGLSN